MLLLMDSARRRYQQGYITQAAWLAQEFQRERLKLWQVAEETGITFERLQEISASRLHRMHCRLEFAEVLKLSQWLGVPPQEFLKMQQQNQRAYLNRNVRRAPRMRFG